MKEILLQQIERVAETHFFLRLKMNIALQNQFITPEARSRFGGHKTYYEYWQASFGDKFFDMTTMVRLGTSIESCLKQYYMHRKGYSSNVELHGDPRYEKNVFQRVQSWQNNGAIKLYRDQIGYDLDTNPHLKSIQEIMMHRHLYAHNAGLLDDDYITKIGRIIGENAEVKSAAASLGYPQEDVYWFRPLKRLSEFIEETRRFFASFRSGWRQFDGTRA